MELKFFKDFNLADLWTESYSVRDYIKDFPDDEMKILKALSKV